MKGFSAANRVAQNDTVVGNAIRLIVNSGGVARGSAKGIQKYADEIVQTADKLIPAQARSLAKTKNISLDEATQQISKTYNSIKKQAGTSYDALTADKSAEEIQKMFGGFSRDEVIDAATIKYGAKTGGAPIGTSEKDLKNFEKSVNSHVKGVGTGIKYQQGKSMVGDFFPYKEGFENMNNGMSISENTELQGALIRTGVTAGAGLIVGNALFGDDDY